MKRSSSVCDSCGTLVLNAVAEDADAAEFNLNEVAGRHEELRLALKPYAAGRSRADDVARPQGRERGNVGHQSLDGKIISPMAACWTTLPLRRVVSVKFRGSLISSAVTIHGPKAPVAGKFFPGVNCGVWRCQSRTVTSL